MDALQSFIDFMNANVVELGITIGGEQLPFMVILLLGTGVFLTLRLGFIQLRQLGHGIAVTSGKYDDPDEPGDVPHFQALTTALSATVGIGNIAGVALALHWGGPGAVFWMWVTAFLGMATKYSEVTLAQKYRHVDSPSEKDPHKWEGSVSGGPMYYIERGLGRLGKPLAIFFAALLGLTAFLTGNGIQANTVADTMQSTFGISPWITGLATSAVVGAVIIGGITRIGRVTSVIAPLMALVYVLGALVILIVHAAAVPGAFGLIFAEAFNPTAGVAGTGTGAILVTMMWGVRRGLFSNEAGQGSAPIAHAAAKTDEPVSEGVVALLEPFIDTIIICSMTALVIIVTGVWKEAIPTEIALGASDVTYVRISESGRSEAGAPFDEIVVVEGVPQHESATEYRLGWHDVPVADLYVDAELTRPFDGVIDTVNGVATTRGGERLDTLHGLAFENGAPLTMLGFQRGLSSLGNWGHYIVLFSVLLFAVSTAISWSYYGDRCANYLFGHRAVLPYRVVFVVMHFLGAVVPLGVAWALGDVALALVIVPNLVALILLSGQVKSMTDSYFERRPWVENAEVHKRVVESRKKK